MPSVRPDPGLVERLRAAGCVFAEEEAGLLAAAAGSADELERMVTDRAAICLRRQYASKRSVIPLWPPAPWRRTRRPVARCVA